MFAMKSWYSVAVYCLSVNGVSNKVIKSPNIINIFRIALRNYKSRKNPEGIVKTLNLKIFFLFFYQGERASVGKILNWLNDTNIYERNYM